MCALKTEDGAIRPSIENNSLALDRPLDHIFCDDADLPPSLLPPRQTERARDAGRRHRGRHRAAARRVADGSRGRQGDGEAARATVPLPLGCTLSAPRFAANPRAQCKQTTNTKHHQQERLAHLQGLRLRYDAARRRLEATADKAVGAAASSAIRSGGGQAAAAEHSERRLEETEDAFER